MMQGTNEKVDKDVKIVTKFIGKPGDPTRWKITTYNASTQPNSAAYVKEFGDLMVDVQKLHTAAGFAPASNNGGGGWTVLKEPELAEKVWASVARKQAEAQSNSAATTGAGDVDFGGGYDVDVPSIARPRTSRKARSEFQLFEALHDRVTLTGPSVAEASTVRCCEDCVEATNSILIFCGECGDCGTWRCPTHDERVHRQYCHCFHQRTVEAPSIALQLLNKNEFLSANGEQVEFKRSCSAICNKYRIVGSARGCSQCGGIGVAELLWDSTEVMIIALKGMVCAVRAKGAACSTCRQIIKEAQIITSPMLWAATVERPETYYDVSMLQAMWAYECASPSMGVITHLNALDTLHQACDATPWGGRTISRPRKETFDAAFSEWKRVNFLNMQLHNVNMQKCVVCSHHSSSGRTYGATCVHIDGNAKLYCYKTGKQVDKKSDENPLPSIDEELDWHGTLFNVAAASKAFTPSGDNDNPKHSCGHHFKAAGKSDKRPLALRGTLIATCNHDVISRMVPMLAGERFALYDFMFDEAVDTLRPRFFAQDLICSLWPHLLARERRTGAPQIKVVASGVQRAASGASVLAAGDGTHHASEYSIRGVRGVLGALHSYAHNTNCMWQYGCRFAEHAPSIFAENAEHSNSRMSKLKSVVRTAHLDTYFTRISESGHHSNSQKNRMLPRQLKRDRNRIAGQLAEAEKVWRTHVATLTVSGCDTDDATMSRMLASIKDALNDKSAISDAVASPQDLVRYYSLQEEIKSLEYAASVGPRAVRVLTEAIRKENLHCHLESADIHNQIRQLSQKLKSLAKRINRRLKASSDGLSERSLRAAADATFRICLDKLIINVTQKCLLCDRNYRQTTLLDSRVSEQINKATASIQKLEEKLKALKPLCCESFRELVLPKTLEDIASVPVDVMLHARRRDGDGRPIMEGAAFVPAVLAWLRVQQLRSSLDVVRDDMIAWSSSMDQLHTKLLTEAHILGSVDVSSTMDWIAALCPSATTPEVMDDMDPLQPLVTQLRNDFPKVREPVDVRQAVLAVAICRDATDESFRRAAAFVQNCLYAAAVDVKDLTKYHEDGSSIPLHDELQDSDGDNLDADDHESVDSVQTESWQSVRVNPLDAVDAVDVRTDELSGEVVEEDAEEDVAI